MKNIIIIICLALLITSCRMPSDPHGEIKIINRVDIIDTGGNCLDVDVDIMDSTIVVAANYNGYFIYKINSANGIIKGIQPDKTIHVSPDDMFESQGDNRAQTVDLSINHDIAFIMDQYDHIWLYKYGENASQYLDNFLDESNCYSGTWLDVAIDDQLDKIGVFSLIKHNAAEESGASYLEYSTSLVWSNLESIDYQSTSFDGDEPDCEYIMNQGVIANKVFFDSGLLSLSYGELGVRVLKQTDLDICLVGSDIVDFEDEDYKSYDDFCIENHMILSEVDYKNCCEVAACPGGVGQCPWLSEEGLGGVFSSAGGMIPKIYAEFDTNGEVDAIFSSSNIIFSGLSNSNGCVMTVLDENGMITNSIKFAEGYSIKGIHQDLGLLVLAAGHDGVLIYGWDQNSVSFRGRIKTSYANSVKIVKKNIFIATEDGLEIIQID